MRIIFINLHCNIFYLKPLDFFLRGKNYKTYKHDFLLKYLIKNNKDIGIYINDNGSSLPSWIKKVVNNRFFRKLECKLVLRLNGYYPNNIKIIDDINDIHEKDIIIGNMLNYEDLYDLNKFKGIKLVYFTHFTYRQPLSEIRSGGMDSFILESDLSENPLFKKNYEWYKNKFYILPHTFQARFKSFKPFEQRKNNAVAVGTLAYCDQPEFVRYYNTSVLHPMGKIILDQEKELRGFIDSCVSYVREKEPKKILTSDIILISLYKKLYNYYNFDKQTKYHSFDMVEKFNEYKMFICPEEITGVPRIGFVEGMACGCAYLGLDHKMYTDLGLVSGTHYIGYDGTIEDLLCKISYYMSHDDELQKIAETGSMYVRKYFNPKAVARKFYHDLYNKSIKKI